VEGRPADVEGLCGLTRFEESWVSLAESAGLLRRLEEEEEEELYFASASFRSASFVPTTPTSTSCTSTDSTAPDARLWTIIFVRRTKVMEARGVWSVSPRAQREVDLD
jgi:hypothetical protein